MPLWLLPQPLVLASQSAARRTLLLGAGIPIEVVPAAIEEREFSERAGSARAVAALLAHEKARAVAKRLPGRIVAGADQVLILEDQLFSKPADRVAARAQLRILRGRSHELHSAIAVVRAGAVVFEHREVARLTMRAFSDEFLERYLDAAGSAITQSVGGYQVERAGIQLFERVEGDYFTILGLPLMPLLAFFRREGWLAQ
jgi:septum formation protein